jgi:hypothetical protein
VQQREDTEYLGLILSMFGGLHCYELLIMFGLNTKINLHFIQRFTSYPTEKKLCL